MTCHKCLVKCNKLKKPPYEASDYAKANPHVWTFWKCPKCKTCYNESNNPRAK